MQKDKQLNAYSMKKSELNGKNEKLIINSQTRTLKDQVHLNQNNIIVFIYEIVFSNYT